MDVIPAVGWCIAGLAAAWLALSIPAALVLGRLLRRADQAQQARHLTAVPKEQQ